MSVSMADAPAPAQAPAGSASLVQRLARSEPEALEELIALHQHRVRALAGRLLGWNDGVDDVVQDVFVRVVENVGRFRGQSRLDTWITRITINCCRSWHRRRRTGQFHLPRWWNQQAQVGIDTVQSDLAADESTRLVRQAVRELPRRYREVVVLRYLEEYSVTEIAELLKTRPNTVNVRLSRARQQLRQILGPQDYKC